MDLAPVCPDGLALSIPVLARIAGRAVCERRNDVIRVVTMPTLQDRCHIDRDLHKWVRLGTCCVTDRDLVAGAGLARGDHDDRSADEEHCKPDSKHQIFH